MTKDFFPSEDYSIPSTSNYMKFKEGDNTFRALSSAVVGYEYWNKDNKPVRSREPVDVYPLDIREDSDIKHFWAFVVWNYNEKRVQILEITQKTIQQYIEKLVKNDRWGSPTGFDLTVTRKGSGFETEYTTVANPHSDVDPAILEKYRETKIDLQKLFTGDDPFSN